MVPNQAFLKEFRQGNRSPTPIISEDVVRSPSAGKQRVAFKSTKATPINERIDHSGNLSKVEVKSPI